MKRRLQGGNGPLMTDHLRDLDMELELLKRKRTMIEQQQRLLSDTRPQPYQQDFDQSYQRNYANLYEDDHHRGQPGGSQYGQNYHSDTIWDQPAPQPNYSAQSQAHYEFSGNRNNDRLGNKKKQRRPNPWANPVPLLNTPVIPGILLNPSGPKVYAKTNRARAAPPKRKNDFKPTKVTKHNTNSPVDFLKTQTPQNRKDLVKGLVAPRKVNEKFLPNVTPSNQVVGRMEFCLGTVLKDIRANYGKTHAKLLFDPNHIRMMKQVIRERIQEVMLGKVVDGNQCVIDRYREKYPIHTDKAIVDLCFDEETVQRLKKCVKTFLPEDDPAKFFRINFHHLFVQKFDDMFAKIALLHRQQNKKPVEEIIKDLPDLTVDGKGCSAPDNEETTNKTSTDDITNGNNENSEEQTEKPETTVTTQAAVENTEEGEKVKENAPETESKPQQAEEESNTENKETSVNENGEKNPKEKMSNEEKTNFYLKLIDQLIEQRLPVFIKNRSEDIIKVMNLDAQFKATRAAIILETNKKAERLAKLPVLKEKVKKQYPLMPKRVEGSTEKAESNDQTAKKPSQLYVKILAKPDLPETSVMKAFLDKFNPKSIKKPRTLQNLLIIGLATQEDVDKLVAENGTEVGNKKLIITKNERIKIANEQKEIKVEGNDEKPIIIEDNNEEKPEISEDLDSQITDLLTSIRKAEEDETEEVKDTATVVKTENVGEVEPAANVADAADVDVQIDERISETESNKPDEVKPDETEPVVTKANTNEANTTQVEEIQNDATVVPSTPTRSSARITRSKLAN